MSLWRNGEEAIQVDIECVDHFGERPDYEKLVSDYAAIGSAAEWARRCGEAVRDDPQTWEAVAMLLDLGTRKSNATSLALMGFRRLCPDATAAAFWIFRHTDHHSHNKVYAELLCCLPAGPDSSNFRDWERRTRWYMFRITWPGTSRTGGKERAKARAPPLVIPRHTPHRAELDKSKAIAKVSGTVLRACTVSCRPACQNPQPCQ